MAGLDTNFADFPFMKIKEYDSNVLKAYKYNTGASLKHKPLKIYIDFFLLKKQAYTNSLSIFLTTLSGIN